MIAASSVVHPGVALGDSVTIEDFCLIGIRPANWAPDPAHGDAPTRIGPGALIRAGTYIYAGNQIGRDFQTGNKTNIRESNQIGDQVSIGSQTVIEHHVTIGDRVRIHSMAFIPEYSVIEAGAWIGPRVTFTNAKYPLDPGAKASLKGPIIRRGAIIGANATLLPAVEIGEGCLIGAGSVVTRNCEAYGVYAGNPARLIRKREPRP